MLPYRAMRTWNVKKSVFNEGSREIFNLSWTVLIRKLVLDGYKL